MRVDELADLLREVPGTEVTAAPGLVTVHVPAIGDTARLAFRDILEAEWVYVPTEAPALEIGIRRGHEQLPLIVTVDDLVFTPAYADDLVDPAAELRVPAMPSLISYSEMHRDVRALGKAVDDPAVELDPEMLAATLLAHRCFLAGAVRVGLWPVRVAAWWEFTSARTADRVEQVPIRPHAQWDRLMADVAEARRHIAPVHDAP